MKTNQELMKEIDEICKTFSGTPRTVKGELRLMLLALELHKAGITSEDLKINSIPMISC